MAAPLTPSRRTQTVVLVGRYAATREGAVDLLMSEHGRRLGRPVPHTTRSCSNDDGSAHQVTNEAMEEAIALGDRFVVYDLSQEDGHYTAISREAVDAVRAAGKTCLVDLDARGAEMAQAAGLDAVFVLLTPPSPEHLEQRLQESGLADDALAEELARAAHEADLAERVPGLVSAVVTEGADARETADRLRDVLLPNPRPVVICGPSGVGKGTLINRLIADFPELFGFSVSHTTRAPRPGEVDGKHYHFSDKESMLAAIERGDFVEHAHVHGNYYGTSLSAIAAVAHEGKSCVLDIDIQGARSVKASSLGATFLFIAPPSLEVLEARLRGRGTETEEKVQLRMKNARTEMAAASEAGFFDHVVVNDDFAIAYRTLRRLLTGIAPPVVVCGPSGVGKGTLINMLLKCAPDAFGFSVSHTTRAARPGEVHGKHYHFADKESMLAAIERGEFVEHAHVHGNYYGTSKAAIEAVAREGKSCVLDIDVQGARAVKQTDLGAVFIFIAPPSIEALEARLRGRGTEAEEKIQLRLANAKAELEAKEEPGFFDHVLVNDDLMGTFCHLRMILTGMAPPVVICGPSGVGKGTLINKLIADFPDDFGFSVSHTTRAPRPGEEDGKHYHFADKDSMLAAIECGEFVEHAHVHGNYYGTSKAAVESVTRMGKSCVLDIDVQGARAVRNSSLGAVFIFVAPPSLEALEARLRGRGTEAEEKIQLRLENAKVELEAKDEPGFFHHVIVNEDLEEAYVQLKRALGGYRTLHLSQGLVARSLGQLVAELPPPIPDDDTPAPAYEVANQKLSLRGNYVSEVSLLGRCPTLHEVDVSHNKLRSLEPLGQLRYLLTVDASYNQLREGATFKPPLNLQELNLSHNMVADMECVKGHKLLRKLDLSNNDLCAIAGLDDMAQLQELNLSDNRIDKISGLDGLGFVHTIRLANNSIVHLDGLGARASITSLDLSNNLIGSLRGLSGLTALMDLHLQDNAISNSNEMAHITPLRLLRELNLANNPVVSCGSEAVPYRLHVAQQLPSLVVLDTVAVTVEEKVGAAWHFGAADHELRKIRTSHFPPDGPPDSAANGDVMSATLSA